MEQVKAVAETVEKLRQAMISGKREALEEISAEGLSYGHSNGNVETKAEFTDNIASGRSDFITIDFSEQTIAITNGVAVVRHRFNATTNDGGKPGEVKLKILLVFVEDQDSWKLLARQAVRV